MIKDPDEFRFDCEIQYQHKPEMYGLPPYPEEEVIASCVCGSWPGGKCLHCAVVLHTDLRIKTMTHDPVDTDELRHDCDSAERLARQDALEAEFKADPDWDVVAEHLRKRDTLGDLCSLIGSSSTPHDIYERFDRARRMIRLAIDQCAREYGEREAGH